MWSARTDGEVLGGLYLADKNGEAAGIDFREKAPEKSTPTMFLTNGEVDTRKSDVGHLVIGVPGSVRGFYEASKRYGKLDWKAVVEPALKLARDGFVVDEVLSKSLKSQERVMATFTEFGRVYRKSERLPMASKVMRRQNCLGSLAGTKAS
jgi:gamma-glutamyltranspeptidase/glutathione hydrolase